MPSSRESSPPRGAIMSPALAGWFFTTSTIWEALLLHVLCKITITTNNLTSIDFQHFSQATGTQIKHRNLCTGFTTVQIPSLPPRLTLKVACNFFYTSLPALFSLICTLSSSFCLNCLYPLQSKKRNLHCKSLT